jgi:hypothetical protein
MASAPETPGHPGQGREHIRQHLMGSADVRPLAQGGYAGHLDALDLLPLGQAGISHRDHVHVVTAVDVVFAQLLADGPRPAAQGRILVIENEDVQGPGSSAPSVALRTSRTVYMDFFWLS